MGLKLLVLLGLIGMEFAAISSGTTGSPIVLYMMTFRRQMEAIIQGILPPPLLSVITPGTFHMHQSVEVQCTAPRSYPECMFYLFSESSGKILQTLEAPESWSSVMFTLHNFSNWGTMMYVCKYQCRVGNGSQKSDASVVLSLTILDGPGPTVSSHTPATKYVPPWATILVGVVAAFVILVAAVYVTVRVVRRHKQKKQEQRDKESIWIDQSMTKDWGISHHNQVFSMNFTSETDLPHPEISCKDSQAERGPAIPFSSFRTLQSALPVPNKD